MKSTCYKRVAGFCSGVVLLLALVTPGVAQIQAVFLTADSVSAASVPNNPTPDPNATISVAINVDVSALQAPNNRLAAYQATLKWDPAVIQFLSTTPAPAPWDTPNLNTNDVATGKLEWNDFAQGGSTGMINILNVNFKVIGVAGSSTVLDLNFTEMTTSTFMSLLNVLRTKDGKVMVRGNDPPVVNAIADQTMNEGAALNVAISATDPENGKIKFSALNLPAFGGLTDNNNNTGTIQFTPGFNAAGVYSAIGVIATDNGIPAKSDTAIFKLTVNNVNRPPLITPLSPQISVNEGVVSEIPLSATDPDGDQIKLSGKNLPAFAMVIDNGNGTGRLRLTPGRNDSGDYPNIVVSATDNGVPLLSDSTRFDLKVLNTLPTLECKIEIVRPSDGAVVCDDSVEVCVSTTIIGTIGSSVKMCEVNGVPLLTGCVKIPLASGANKILAKLTVKDSLDTCVAFDSVTVSRRQFDLACKLTIASPADSAVFCSDSLEVKGATTITGGVPLAVKCDVNGVPVVVTGGTFTARVKLNPGWNNVIATCTITDSCGAAIVCRDTVRVRSIIDKIPPTCVFTPGYKSVTGTLFDHESGIAKVEPIFLFNAKLTVDPFTPGAKQVNFRVDDLGLESYLGFDIKITDMCGNTHICDPVVLELTADRANNPYVFTFRSVDRYFHVSNKGLSEIRVELNGKRFSLTAERRGGVVQSLGIYALPREGEVTIDLQPYLRREGDNDIRIEVAGPAGSKADLLLIDDLHEAEQALALQQVPVEYELSQNYPNPFNPQTVIRFGIPAHVAAGTPVQLRIYNTLGELVRTLVDQTMLPGRYTARWNGRNNGGVPVAAGIYFYRLVAGDYSATRRLLLLK